MTLKYFRENASTTLAAFILYKVLKYSIERHINKKKKNFDILSIIDPTEIIRDYVTKTIKSISGEIKILSPSSKCILVK